MAKTKLSFDEWETIVKSMRLHLLAAEDPRQAMEISRELRAWLDLEPAKDARDYGYPLEIPEPGDLAEPVEHEPTPW